MSTTKKKAQSAADVVDAIAREIADERQRQHDQWGQQDHPSSYSDLDIKRAEKHANRWKQVNDARANDGTLTWDGILLEEVYEALAEKDPAARRIELIQVAAVAAAEVEAIDRALAAGPVSASESPEVLCPKTGDLCEQGCETACSLIEVDTPDDAA